MRKVAGRLRLDLASYRALEAFAQFASELDDATQQQLRRGQRLVATLNQPQYYAVAVREPGGHRSGPPPTGFTDPVEVADVPRYHAELLQYLEAGGKVLTRSARPASCPTRRRPSCARRPSRSRELPADRGRSRVADLMATQQDIKRRITLRQQHQEDHEGHGAGGGLAPAPRPGPDRGAAAVRRPHAAADGGRCRRHRRSHDQPLLARREVKTVAVVALTGDRGLAGAFNANVVRRSLEIAREQRAEGREVVWLVVGRRGASTLRFRRQTLTADYAGITDRPSYCRRAGDRRSAWPSSTSRGRSTGGAGLQPLRHGAHAAAGGGRAAAGARGGGHGRGGQDRGLLHLRAGRARRAGRPDPARTSRSPSTAPCSSRPRPSTAPA